MEKITNRLAAAAGFVRRGARLCDVGTDHAYLPIFLCKAGIADCALASDINEGPCARARSNVALHGCGDRITVVRAAGLDAAADFAPTDVVIAGMGGEMIRDIVFSSPLTRDPKIRLILQPMTKVPALRAALCENGFEIVGEALARDDRIYQVICAEYTGEVTRLSDVELLVGPVNLKNNEPVLEDFISQNISRQKKIIFSKTVHRLPCVREKELVAALEAALDECRREKEKQ